ncbi:MAG: LCP family protein [Firmicutes bacterium]|jgi:LCP family protein required for cell wall assembly|nr:LCP family protein [Bacillota bacterium]
MASRKKPTSRATKILYSVFIVLFIIVLIASFYFYSLMQNIFCSAQDEKHYVSPRPPQKNKNINVLLLGIDADITDGSRTDTIMVVSFDPEGEGASMLSIPRDTYVNIKGYGYDKINHAHSYGGIPLTLETVEKLLGLEMNYYARINLQGFEAIVDLLGGVVIDVEPEIARVEPILRSGSQRLSGREALSYVRVRKVGSDFGRIQRQQEFLLAVARQSLNASNVTKMPRFVNLLGDNLITNIPPLKMPQLGQKLLRINLDSVKSGYLPGEDAYINGVYYYILDEAGKQQMLKDLDMR